MDGSRHRGSPQRKTMAGNRAFPSVAANGSGSRTVVQQEDVEAEVLANLDSNRRAWWWLTMVKQVASLGGRERAMGGGEMD
jgi:hypothetical protein